MHKKIAVMLLIILSTAALCFVAAACGSGESADTDYSIYLSFSYDNQKQGLVVSVKNVNSLPAALTIPSLYYDDNDTEKNPEKMFNVVAVAPEGFKNITKLTSVSLPDTITIIGREAFSGCNKLTSINTGKVGSIGESAFMDCKMLTAVEFNASKTAIPDSAFKNCNLLKSVSGSAEITGIGESAFQSCTALMKIEADLSKLTDIGYRAFFFTGAMTSFTVPDGCKVGARVFEGWSQYQTVYHYSLNADSSEYWAAGTNGTEFKSLA